jgi:hypothetical protein
MKILMFIMVTSFLVAQAVSAKDYETLIGFDNTEKYTDFKTQVNLRAKDRELLMTQLQELMLKSVAKTLNKNTHLQILITNIDMAGGFLYGGHDLFRVIHDTDRVRLEFSYRLIDENGKVLKEDSVNLTTRNPRLLKRQARKYKHTYFTYEMPLFDNWLIDLNKA